MGGTLTLGIDVNPVRWTLLSTPWVIQSSTYGLSTPLGAQCCQPHGLYNLQSMICQPHAAYILVTPMGGTNSQKWPGTTVMRQPHGAWHSTC